MANTPKPAQDFELPSIGLAKSTAKEGSPSWFKQVAEEHGSTKPQKLEHRRTTLSTTLTMLQLHIGKIQARKKKFIADCAKREADLKTQLKKLQASISHPSHQPQAENAFIKATEIDIQSVTQELENLPLVRDAQVHEFDQAMANCWASIGAIESNCLIFDALTIRREAKGKKTGKHGYSRDTAARILADIASISTMTEMEKAAMDKEESSQDDDEEILTEEESKKIETEAEEL